MPNKIREVLIGYDKELFNDLYKESAAKAAKKIKGILAEPRLITSPSFHGCPGGPEHIRRMFRANSELLSTDDSEIGE